MGEGLARALTIGSIALTIVSLVMAVIFARKASRIRVRFDVARALVGVGAILAMVAITHVATPLGAVGVAIIIGLGLGFAQGSTLEISTGERDFQARRSPLGIILWGAGIVVMQAAGIASRSGIVKVGQTVAWFSVCLGIGLLVGRSGPMRDARRTLAGVGTAMLLASLLLPSVALVGGVAHPAAAQEIQLTDDEVCSLIPPYAGASTEGYEPGAAMEALGSANCIYHVLPTDETNLRVSVALLASADEAMDHLSVAPTDDAAPGGVGAATSLDIGDGAYSWSWIQPSECCGNAQLAITKAALGSFLVVVSGNGPGLDTIAVARDTIASIAEAVPALAQPPTTVETATTTEPAPATTTENVAPATVAGDEGEAPDSDTAAPAAVPGSGAETPIEPEEAAEQAIAGLIAAAAIGLISWGEAAGQIGTIVGGGGGGMPPTRTRTVVISGADAEDIISNGPGSTVPIPKDQQSDLVASAPGEPPITEGRVGSVGIVRAVGAIVRGSDGSVSVSVEVDAFDPAPPPPIPLDPIIDTPPEPQPVQPRAPGVEPPPLPDIDEVYEPPQDAEPVAARPPTTELSLPDIDEVYEPPQDAEPVPPRHPGVEPPPEPPSDEKVSPDGPPDDGMPPDDETVGDEPTDGSPDGPAPAVALRPDEIDDFVMWGVERNRSPEDILEDLEGYNRARGGTGPIELPEPLVQVDTPAGPVTVTAAEAARIRAAMAEVERLSSERDALRGRMAKLDEDAAWWGGLERFPGERLAAGVEDMSTRIVKTSTRIDEIDAEIARLNRRPDPMIWDFKRAGMATREEAFESWENRKRYGWHHDQLTRLWAERNELKSQLTEDLGKYRTTADADRRLTYATERLDEIENGTRPPEMIDYETAVDPDEAYAAALEDWRTRETSGRYFEEAQRLREEIAHRESLTHVSDVEPARPGDRGTVFDRPARELARIAEEQDRVMANYREIDRQLDAAQQIIDGVAGRGSSG